MLMSSRTPLRISFFGGGTDYPEYYERHRGAVVGMAINRYIYISLLRSESFLAHKYRVSYSRLEQTNSLEEIQHPVVKAVLKEFGVDQPLDIGIQSDLPASTGLGSSSAFTVGFVSLIAALRSVKLTKLDLARKAIHIEHVVLHERVGAQDQLHAAFGGINRFDFERNRFRITPLNMTAGCQELLSDSLILVYTGMTRHASQTLDEQMEATRAKKLDNELEKLLTLTDQAVDVLEGSRPEQMLTELGEMLHEGWTIKKQLSSKVSNARIDEAYEVARRNGALGGKLSGAGGGGFLLLLVPPGEQERLRLALNGLQSLNIGLDVQGSTILYS